MLPYINEFDSSVYLYKIYNYKYIKMPTIAIVNKRKSNQIDFLFIKESINGNIVCHDFYVNNDEYFKIPFIEFINNISDIIIC